MTTTEQQSEAIGQSNVAGNDTPAAKITVKFLKAWKGEVAIEADATLEELLSALRIASSLDPATYASLIVRGKKIDLSTVDRGTIIGALGISHNTPVMLVLHDPQRLQMIEQERRMKRLADVEAAARMISERAGGGSGQVEMSLTNQDGSNLDLPEADRKALTLGMMLHAKGREVLERSSQSVLSTEGAGLEAVAAEQEALQDAVQFFEAAERAMDVAERRWLELSDNLPLLLLDSVWASLLLSARRPEAALSEPAAQAAAATRLERAKGLLHRLHGPQMERLAGRPDAGQQRAVYVRLGLLQGALSFHRGELHDARSLLARADRLRGELTLTADDDAKVAELLAMGFGPREARAALLACAKDVGAAAACVLQRRGAAEARVEAEREKRRRLSEIKGYGLTPAGKALDAHALEQLVGLGYVRPLAAEALRQAENDLNEALSALGSAERQEALQLAVMRRAAQAAYAPPADAVRLLEAMGFAADAARRALVVTHGDVSAAATKLASEGPAAAGGAGGGGGAGSPFTADAIAAAVSDAAGSSSAPAPAPPPPPPPAGGRFDDEEMMAIDQSGLHRAVQVSEEAYSDIKLDLEAAAISFFLAAVESRLA